MFENLVASVQKLKNFFITNVYIGTFTSRETMVKKITDALDDIDIQCSLYDVEKAILKINSAIEAITEVKTKGGKFGINITAGIGFQNSFKKLMKLEKNKENLAKSIFENHTEAKHYLFVVKEITKLVRKELENNLNEEDIREKKIYLNNIFDMPYVQGNER